MALSGRDGAEGKASGSSSASCGTKKLQSFKALLRNTMLTLPGCCCRTPENPLWGWKGLGSSIYLSIYLLIFWPHCVTCGILVP